MERNSIGWRNCPDSTKHQVVNLLGGLQKRLGSNLAGVYLHGSLAMGCFNPDKSDIDLLAVVGCSIPRKTRSSLAKLLLSLSGSPHPIEISLLRPEDMVPWRHPAPFELHYSEGWRKRFSDDLTTGSWKHLDQKNMTDTDLAAHITVTRARGIRLCGESIEKISPEIPRKDYLSSLIADLEWAEKRLEQDAVYGVLNSCRVYAYLREGRIFSKEEGAARATNLLSAEFYPLILAALEIYRGGHSGRDTLEMRTARRLLQIVVSAARAAG